VEIIGRRTLDKYAKNNTVRQKVVNEFVKKVQRSTWKNDADVKADFPDADRIFSNVYVFDLTGSDRTLTLVYFINGQVQIVWAGNHQEYERELKNNKDTIRKFLKKKGYNA
jgi:mRNA interferase HigB